MSDAKRQKARIFGLRAEWIAACLVQASGYRILARNFIVPGGELDLIIRRGEVIAFVEVKARPTLDEARLAIDATKRRRMSRAASIWLTRNEWAMRLVLRGDAVFIAPRHWPRHESAVVDLNIG